MSGQRAGIIWSLTDQGISSGSNYLLLILLIRVSTLAELGAYGLVYTSYFLFQACARGLASEPLTVRSSPLDVNWDADRRDASGASVTAGLAMGLVSAALALVTNGSFTAAWLALAICLPGLILQDTVRMVLFAERRMRSAAVNDVIFLLVQSAAFAALIVTEHLTGFWLLLGWGLGAYIAGLLGLIQTRMRIRPLSTWSWVRRHQDIIPAYVADYAANRGAEQLTLIGILAVSGAPVAGVVTAARTLFAPLTTIQTGLNGFTLPEAARLNREGAQHQLRALVWKFATAMAALMVAGGIALALVPEAWGSALLSDNWAPASAVIWPMCLFSALNAAGFALWLGGKARQRGRAVFLVRLGAGLVMVVSATLGALIANAQGAILGMALSALILVLGMGELLGASESE